MDKMLKNKLMIQLMRFAVVGGSAFAIDYGVMIFLTELFGVDYLISCGISFTVSVIYYYILSVKWVFDVGDGRDKRKEFVLFLFMSIIGLGLNQLLMWLLVEKMEIYYMMAKIMVTVVVMVYNFITRKLFLEKKV